MLMRQKDDETVNRIVLATFPDNHKPVSVTEFHGPKNVNSYWDGGSRNEYALYELHTEKVYRVPTSHPFFDRKSNGLPCGNLEMRELPPNTVLVQGGVFCGKPSTIVLYFHPDNLNKLISEKPQVEISENAQKALEYICSMITSGRKEYFRHAKLGEYGPQNPHIKELEEKQLVKVSKNGAVKATVEGENFKKGLSLSAY